MKYLDFFNNFKGLIINGSFSYGEKLPSIRVLALREGYSKNTILQGLYLLESNGLIESHPRSGFFVCYKEEIKSSIKAKKLKGIVKNVNRTEIIENLLLTEANSKIIPLGTAVRSPRILPTQKINKYLKKLINEDMNHSVKYNYASIDNPLNEQIFKHLVTFSKDINPKSIVRTFGATEALFLSLKLVTSPGDTVLVETPVFFGILLILENLGLKVIESSSDYQTGSDLIELEKIIANNNISAGIFSPNFTNPHGTFSNDSYKERLVSIFNKKNIPIIEDDVNGDLFHYGHRPKMLASFDKKGLVFSCSSFSKSLGPGYRVGWIYNERYSKELRKLKLSTNFSSQPLFDLAISYYLKNSSYTKHLKKLNHYFENNIIQVLQALKKHFPDSCNYSAPKGGFSVWVELPKINDSIELYQKALSDNIAIAPGVIFSTTKAYNNFIRVNCGVEIDYDKTIKKLSKHILI